MRGPVGRLRRELVASVIQRIFSMTFYPVKSYLVMLGECLIVLPEVAVLFTAFEIGSDPFVQPFFLNGLDDVLAIGIDGEAKSLSCEGLQGGDDGHQFHSVVGGAPITLRQFLSVIAK